MKRSMRRKMRKQLVLNKEKAAESAAIKARIISIVHNGRRDTPDIATPRTAGYSNATHNTRATHKLA